MCLLEAIKGRYINALARMRPKWYTGKRKPGCARIRVIRYFTVFPKVMLLYTDHVYTLVTCTGVNFGHFNPIIGGRTRIEEMEARTVEFPP